MENFAYVNVMMSELKPLNIQPEVDENGNVSQYYELIMDDASVIGYNSIVGIMRGVIHFKVVNVPLSSL